MHHHFIELCACFRVVCCDATDVYHTDVTARIQFDQLCKRAIAPSSGNLFQTCRPRAGNRGHACHPWHAKQFSTARWSPKLHVNFVMIHTKGIWILTCIKIRILLAHWMIWNPKVGTVAYLCKVAPMKKFKCATCLIILILNIGTILRKIKCKENKFFKMENICFFFALNFSANKI